MGVCFKNNQNALKRLTFHLYWFVSISTADRYYKVHEESYVPYSFCTLYSSTAQNLTGVWIIISYNCNISQKPKLGEKFFWLAMNYQLS